MHVRWFAFLLLLSLVTLSACTAMYQRQFEVIPSEELTIEERRLILVKYREFMESNGYAGVPRRDTSDIVDFQIRDAQSRLLPTSRSTVTVSTRIDSKGQLFVQLFRITSYPPDDFSAEYLRNFAELTRKYLQESSGKQLVLREVPRK